MCPHALIDDSEFYESPNSLNTITPVYFLPLLYRSRVIRYGNLEDRDLLLCYFSSDLRTKFKSSAGELGVFENICGKDLVAGRFVGEP